MNYWKIVVISLVVVVVSACGNDKLSITSEFSKTRDIKNGDSIFVDGAVVGEVTHVKLSDSKTQVRAELDTKAVVDISSSSVLVINRLDSGARMELHSRAPVTDDNQLADGQSLEGLDSMFQLGLWAMTGAIDNSTESLAGYVTAFQDYLRSEQFNADKQALTDSIESVGEAGSEIAADVLRVETMANVEKFVQSIPDDKEVLDDKEILKGTLDDTESGIDSNAEESIVEKANEVAANSKEKVVELFDGAKTGVIDMANKAKAALESDDVAEKSSEAVAANADTSTTSAVAASATVVDQSDTLADNNTQLSVKPQPSAAVDDFVEEIQRLTNNIKDSSEHVTQNVLQSVTQALEGLNSRLEENRRTTQP